MTAQPSSPDGPAPAGPIYVGCAGWSIPKPHAGRFPAAGSHLERYARIFPAVEINSSFYRPHRPATYARWAASVPAGFRFAVKVPKEITHGRRLQDVGDQLAAFAAEAGALGPKLGPWLVQLPPSLRFSPTVVQSFLAALRAQFSGSVVCEPRHPTWFTGDADALLEQFEVARVAADPAVVPAAAVPGGWRQLVYYRLHGSPRMYYSAYSPAQLEAVAHSLATAGTGTARWCIFDNTAENAATADALTLLEQLRR